MKKVTLKNVIVEAIRNKAFLNALIKRHKKALARKRWELTASDNRKLNFMLSREYSLKLRGRALLKVLVACASYIKSKPWPSEIRPK